MHNSLPHEVQIKFDTAAEIEERDDDPSIPLQKFDRVQLRDLQNLSAGCVVDILAFVVEAKELETVLSKAKNEQLMRRELTLLDASGSFVSFTLFGAQALQLPQSALENQPLIAIKGEEDEYYFFAKNEQLMRRELTLLDASGSFVSFTLFGAQALQLPQSALENQPLIAIKGAKVQEYGGRACLLSSAQMQITFLQRPTPAEANRSIQKEAETEAEAETNTKGKTETEAKAKCSSPPQLPGAAGIAAADVEEEFAWFDSKGLDMLCSLQNKGVKAKRPLEIMKVVGVTAEGLKKLEAGGRDTRGRTFTDILQQLIFAVGLLPLFPICKSAAADEATAAAATAAATAAGAAPAAAVATTAAAAGTTAAPPTPAVTEFRFDLVAKCEVYKDNKTVQILVRAASDETEDPWAKVQDSVRLTERILSSQFAICQQH
ncbi:Replication protein A 70 kDa subunit, related [Eimeria praecox]|uniref:Replication protein A 70 kDa subunit, related n=1 Tax=Eimeria praecox TaxID=51316 RepID=U6G413_9EIME|nr:Replication protein A 70 kDa subunit, related [Eimeria praecox]